MKAKFDISLLILSLSDAFINFFPIGPNSAEMSICLRLDYGEKLKNQRKYESCYEYLINISDDYW